MSQVINKRIVWREEIPDPFLDRDEIGDKLELQILIETDGRLISGHWEMSAVEYATVVFVPDWLTKDIIENDDIEYWCFTRDIR